MPVLQLCCTNLLALASLAQIRFKVFDALELQPLLDAANAEKEAAVQT